MIALLAVGVAQVFLYYPQMPDVMASHFDASGHPNGWMSRQVFMAIHLSMLAMVAACFLWLPRITPRFPLHLWSMPHRDYWLAPERREQTMDYVQTQMVWCGVATTLFLLAVSQLAFEANLTRPTILSSAMWWLLIGYFVYIGWWTVMFILRFRRIPQ
jgi:uncharacterized membrane protein